MAGAFIAKAVVVGAAALVGWGLAKLVSSSLASQEHHEKTTDDKGNWMGNQIPRNQFEDFPYDSFPPDEKVDERERRFESYQIPYELFGSTELQAARSDYEGKKICWRFPGSGKLKLNTDGSVKWRSNQKDGSVRYINPPRAGFGGVIRDERGSLIVGFYGRLKDGCEILEAELWGIYKGLEIIQDRNLREVVEIESDSQAAVYLIENETAYRRSRFKEIAEKCKAMKLEMGCTLEHALREGNRVADKLAKQGRDQYNDLITFTAPSKKISICLRADFELASSSFVADAA